MRKIPRDPAFDSIFALLGDPYRFISERCRRFQSDLFQTRLLTTRAICLTGAEGAELFCDHDRLRRRGAALRRIEKTLAGSGGVQGLDDDAHRHRKAIFLSIVPAERVAQLADIVGQEWIATARRWSRQDKVVLYDETKKIIARAVCQWAAVPVADDEVDLRTSQLAAMYEHVGSIGPKHMWARHARRQSERWIMELIEQVRTGKSTPPAESALHKVAWHRELNGNYLPRRIAAVELLNVLRPTIAVSVYITQAALALDGHPECRALLADDAYAENFAHEVRRYFPFVPFISARARRDFEWLGYRFHEGTRVLLDLYGTNHDERYWDSPEEFRPERFATWEANPFTFIPQGPGDRAPDHRCPGEEIAVALIKASAQFLACEIAYDVPPQDLALDFGRMPALPKSRFEITRVRTVVAAGC